MRKAARDRATVTLADGRTGSLIYWPPTEEWRRGKKRPRVLLPWGAYITVDADQIVAVSQDSGTPTP